MKKFISKNLRYPDGQCITGKVYVGFTVDSLGIVKDIKIKNSITKEADAEAVRVVKLMTFIPGTISGKPSNMKMVIPISFTINYSDKKNK
jgi:TonB family protein